MKLIDADILEKSLTEIDEHINMDIFTNEVRELIDNVPIVEAIPKEQMVAMLSELKYDLYQELCKEIHGKEDCPCTNQTTSCLAKFRVCDANRAINKVIQQRIDKLKGNEK